SFLYRAPRSFAFQWQRDGSDVSGATGTTFTPTEGGSYTCAEIATNQAGSTRQTSGAVDVKGFSVVKREPNRHKGRVKATVGVPAAGHLTLSGDQARSRSKWPGGPGQVHILAGAHATGSAKRELRRTGKAHVHVDLAYTPPGGSAAHLDEKLTLARD